MLVFNKILCSFPEQRYIFLTFNCDILAPVQTNKLDLIILCLFIDVGLFFYFFGWSLLHLCMRNVICDFVTFLLNSDFVAYLLLSVLCCLSESQCYFCISQLGHC